MRANPRRARAPPFVWHGLVSLSARADLKLLNFSIILLIIGLLGLFITRKNAIMLLIALELLILSVNINFIFSSLFLDDLLGIIYSLINLTSAASGSAIGLALLIYL